MFRSVRAVETTARTGILLDDSQYVLETVLTGTNVVTDCRVKTAVKSSRESSAECRNGKPHCKSLSSALVE